MIYHQDRLLAVDKKLVNLCLKVSEKWDVIIVCGFRGCDDQNKAFKEGKSKLQWPNSAHNKTPSKAVDVAPYDPIGKKIDWSDRSCKELRQYIDEVAKETGVILKPVIEWDNLHCELK